MAVLCAPDSDLHRSSPLVMLLDEEESRVGFSFSTLTSVASGSSFIVYLVFRGIGEAGVVSRLSNWGLSAILETSSEAAQIFFRAFFEKWVC